MFAGLIPRPRARREVDWDVIWADVGWIRDCFDHMRFEDHQVGECGRRCPRVLVCGHSPRPLPLRSA